MALSAGDRLGHYEILAPLGAGGMGDGLDLVGDNTDLYFGLGQAHVFMYDWGVEPTDATLQEAEVRVDLSRLSPARDHR